MCVHFFRDILPARQVIMMSNVFDFDHRLQRCDDWFLLSKYCSYQSFLFNENIFFSILDLMLCKNANLYKMS